MCEDRFMAFLGSIEDGCYELDLDGNLTWFNRRIPEISGYSAEELTGKNYRDYTDAANAVLLYKAYHEVFKTGAPSKGLEFDLVRKDGSRVCLESSITLVRDASGNASGFRGIVRDITEKKHAQRALQESEERYRALAENIQDVIWVIQDMKFTYVSPSVQRQWGYRVEDVTGRPVGRFLSTSSCGMLEDVLSEVLRSGGATRAHSNCRRSWRSSARTGPRSGPRPRSIPFTIQKATWRVSRVFQGT